MANGWGGKRPGAGRKASKFREFCRETVLSDEVLAKLKEAAQESPEFALKLADHGFGRPHQAIAVTSESTETVIRKIEIGAPASIPDANGDAAITPATLVPAPGVPQ